jgi:hypothetical protein
MTMEQGMVSRVAAAIEAAKIAYWAQFSADHPMTDEEVPAEVLARAAIEAMKKPTDAMVEAWAAEMERQHVAFDEFAEPAYPVQLWQAMISAALSEPLP